MASVSMSHSLEPRSTSPLASMALSSFSVAFSCFTLLPSRLSMTRATALVVELYSLSRFSTFAISRSSSAARRACSGLSGPGVLRMSVSSPFMSASLRLSLFSSS